MKKIVGVLGLFLFLTTLKSQVPTVQDCLGAIPVCQSMYTENVSYSGDGNIVDYDGDSDCSGLCLDPEDNSVWYTFTVQQSGVLDFRISPNVANTDYDWALFNLTNRNCSDLQTSAINQCIASCNSAYDYGTTGANSLTPNTNSNCQGPSSFGEYPVNNSTLNVVAGQTYYLNIQNWSGTTTGYTLDFSNSTANIFDNVKPVIDTVLNVLCGEQSIRFRFSENVLCNTIQSTDFSLTGPSGNIPITGVTGQACAQGGTQEISFVLTVGQALQAGTYTLTLNPAISGSVTDLCGNAAIQHSLQFTINGIQVAISTTPADCQPNGSATAIGSAGLAPYQYVWSNGITTSVNSNIINGTYQVTVTDNRGCIKTSTANVLGSGSGLQLNVAKSNVSCAQQNDGTISISVIQGVPPFSYHWSDGNTQQNRVNLPAGTYTVTVNDVNSCSSSQSIDISEPSPINVHIVEIINDFCSQGIGEIEIEVSGGLPPYLYQWNVSGLNTNRITGLYNGQYVVNIRDSGNCLFSLPFEITGTPKPIADFNAVPWRASIQNPNIQFVDLSDNATAYIWDFGDGSSSNAVNPTHLYSDTGHFNVMLIAQISTDCADTAIKEVYIYQDLVIWIPNAFTPDNDGLNESFGPSGMGYEPSSYEMKIYDRWGQLIFVSHDFDKKWDGRQEGKMIFDDLIFVYNIQIADLNGKDYRFVGKVLKLGSKFK